VNEVLKQRLVGALILIALGVLFWPIIFVEPDEMSAVMEGRIPPRPLVNTQPISPPSDKGLRKSPVPTAVATPEQPSAKQTEKQAKKQSTKQPDVARAELKAANNTPPATAQEPLEKPAAATAQRKTRTQPPEKPRLDADGVPIAWILQVASVSKPEKAEELRTQLLAMGYKAYIKKVHSGGNVLLRVYIGPKFERAKLDDIKAGVDSRFAVQSIVVRYTP
jgi:DedD protein